ncbi:MAG: response regulator [Adhaeribacter sp.]
MLILVGFLAFQPMPPGKNILLVDDDEISNFLTATVLRNSQVFADIKISLDGQEALAWLQQKQRSSGLYPDLILLDLNMPKMNGFKFLQSLRELPGPNPKSPIVVLSTSNFQEDFDQLRQYPEVEVFLHKPLTEESLHYLLNRFFPEN